MKCRASEVLKRELEEGVPKSDFNSLSVISRYYQNLRNNIKEMQKVTNDCYTNGEYKDNPEYFKRLFKYFDIVYKDEDVKNFLEQHFGGQYRVHEIKTQIPMTRYSIKENQSIYSLLNIVVAVSDATVINIDKEYSLRELMELRNSNKLVFVKEIKDESRRISAHDFTRYARDNGENHSFVPLLLGDNETVINRVNFANLMAACPDFFIFLRSGELSVALSLAEYEYAAAVDETVEKDMKACDEKIAFYEEAKRKMKN